MNVTFFGRIVGLTLIMVNICDAHAGLLEETCDLAYEKLSSGPNERLTKSIGVFTNDNESYHGCVIRFLGNANKITDTQRPGGLFGDGLPYCPGGKLPPDVPPNKDGWCGDRMADGPDGTYFRVLKNDVFCLVQGSWDGGDDGDPTYVPSPRYSIIVMCGTRK
jgi:hypothetical protein